MNNWLLTEVQWEATRGTGGFKIANRKLGCSKKQAKGGTNGRAPRRKKPDTKSMVRGKTKPKSWLKSVEGKKAAGQQTKIR